MDCYFGRYHAFDTVSKQESAVLAGPDNLIGDEYEVAFSFEDGKQIAWLVNRFGTRVGYFDAEFSRTLSLIKAREWVIKPMLSFVAYTDHPEPSRYWGEMAVVCYSPSHTEAFDAYAKEISRRLGEGVRPDISLSDQGVRQVIESGGSWSPKSYTPLPNKVPGTAIVKKSRSAKEKLIEEGRKGNKGCYVASWVFLAIIAIGAVFGLKSCGLF